MSGDAEVDEGPIRLENIVDDIENYALSITDGIYAIGHMTRDAFNNPVEADAARSGIHWIGLKLEDELRVLRERAAQACERVRGKDW